MKILYWRHFWWNKSKQKGKKIEQILELDLKITIENITIKKITIENNSEPSNWRKTFRYLMKRKENHSKVNDIKHITGPNHVCVILSRRRDTITSVWYFISMEIYKVSGLRDTLSILNILNFKPILTWHNIVDFQ